MLGAEIEHLLRFGDTADERAGEAAAPHDEVEHGRRRMWLCRRANERHHAIALQQHKKRVEIVRRRHGVDDEVEAVRLRRHCVHVARHDHFVRTKTQRIGTLGFRGREQHDVGAECVRELDGHVSEPAKPHDADAMALAHLPVAQR